MYYNQLFIILLFLIRSIFCASSVNNCIPQDFGHGSVVCVCNRTYCDYPEQIGELSEQNYFQVTSSKEGQRFSTFIGNKTQSRIEGFNVPKDGEIELIVYRNQTFQSIAGFGGAFTDAAGINIASVSSELQEIIIRSYYGDEGLGYIFGRIPMGGSDFSTRQYSYDDDVENDTDLKYFALTQEDTKLKIPFLKVAQKFRANFKLLAAPWSAPKWMKTNNDFIGYGFLKPEYYQVWAYYFIRFLQEYEKHNLTMWGVSTQNEPIDGQIPGFTFNCMGWTPENQRDWIKNNLGPTLHNFGFDKVKIIIFDDQRPFLNIWIRKILQDPEAAKYVAGIGVHWYFDFFPPSILDKANKEFPEYFLMSTEACVTSFLEHPVLLGSWERGESYAEDIMEDLNHYVTSWLDWNLALNLSGGPNWSGNFVDSPVIVDKDIDVIYKQPMYYAIGHFSKYILENSIRIATQSSHEVKGFQTLTVLRPDNLKATVVLNKLSESIRLTIKEPDSEMVVNVDIGPRSIQTIVY